MRSSRLEWAPCPASAGGQSVRWRRLRAGARPGPCRGAGRRPGTGPRPTHQAQHGTRRTAMWERGGGTRRRQISLATWSSACRASPEESRACASYTPDLALACAVQDLSRCDARGGCPRAARTSAYSAAACFAILRRRPSSAEASTSLQRQLRMEGCHPQQAHTEEQIRDNRGSMAPSPGQDGRGLMVVHRLLEEALLRLHAQAAPAFVPATTVNHHFVSPRGCCRWMPRTAAPTTGCSHAGGETRASSARTVRGTIAASWQPALRTPGAPAPA